MRSQWTYFWFWIFILPHLIFGNNLILQDNEDKILEIIMDIVTIGRAQKDWPNVFCAGKLPDTLFKRLQGIHSTFTVITDGDEDFGIEDVMPYAPHTAFLAIKDFANFENLFHKVITSPYWHPLTNVILFYEGTLTNHLIANIFFILWFYKVCNVVIVQFDKENLHLTHYNPYVNGNDLNNFGCWTVRKIGIPPSNFNDGFLCVEGCHNVTQCSKLRANNLGTCIAFKTNIVSYKNQQALQELNLFEDLGKNLHGFALRAYTAEVRPFMKIEIFDNGTHTLGSRDGNIWNTLSKSMNFSIDLSPSADTIKSQFSFERSIQQIYGFAHRKVDIFLMPIYQFDLIIVDLDYTFPTKESGLCLLAHRADFETSLINANMLKENINITIEFAMCFLSMWIFFFIYSIVERHNISLDQAGKDLINVFRSMLSITLYKAPSSRSFRIYLAVSIWCFFVLNFFTQAAIISFFSSFRRGKDVNTFEDVIEKGYPIEGLASPDAMLPETEDRFNKLNSKLVGIQDLFECAENLRNDSHRFCLVDCAVARYLERNKLNEKGQQYLHVAKQDKFHSLYLNIIFAKHCPLTKQYNKIIMSLFEAGLVRKWEEYRYTDIKEEAQVKALSLEDLMGIFKLYGLMIGLCMCVFLVEILLGFYLYLKNKLKIFIMKWRRRRLAKKKIALDKKNGKIKQVESFTQTC